VEAILDTSVNEENPQSSDAIPFSDESVEPRELDVDTDELIERFEPHEIDEDELYELREACEYVGVPDLAARVEIERTNKLIYDGYPVRFTPIDTEDIARVLGEAKRIREQRGELHRVQELSELIDTFYDSLEGEKDNN
jgi:hypothetical protein